MKNGKGILKCMTLVLCPIFLVVIAAQWFLASMRPQVRNINVTSSLADEILDKYLWGERFECTCYVKGIEAYLHSWSEERVKCLVDINDISWKRLDALLKQQWLETLLSPDESEEEISMIGELLEHVDFVPGTLVAARSKIRGGDKMLLLRESNGQFVMYLFNIHLPKEDLDKLLLPKR